MRSVATRPRRRRSRSSTPARRATWRTRTSGSPEGGDVEGAKALLEESGETLPYPIKLTYPIGSDASEKAFAALKATYDEAGFDVTLDGLDPSGPYYEQIQKPGSDSDLIWGGWGADWPSISTVIPPLFDSRINLTKASNGQDYGNYKSDEVNAAMDAASAEIDIDKANQMWADIDNMLADDVAYIPLDTTKFYFLHGSNIENYVNSVGHQRLRRPGCHLRQGRWQVVPDRVTRQQNQLHQRVT